MSLGRPGTDGVLSADRRKRKRMRRGVWHFTVWHFLNATHCSQRNLPPVTFSLLISVSSHCSRRCARFQTFSLFNEGIHSNRLVIWAAVQKKFIYLWFPGGTVLASEGHLSVGEGALKVTGWRSPAESDLLLTHTSSIIPLFLLFFYSLVCLYFCLSSFCFFCLFLLLPASLPVLPL